ncbi:MAG: hypothetical protein R3F19_25240 [Verrucomicrobiales bacterium]|nr:hypothetical protein [Verrucomicrobiae bacterium]
MKLKDLKDVLTFAAFLPEPDDSGAAWNKRFPGKRTLLLNIGKDSTSWRVMDKKGVIGEAGKMEGPFKEILAQMAEEWKTLADDGWCAVSLNSRFVISLEINLSRRQGVEEVLRTNPKAALGAKAERGKRYNLAHNPESNTSMLLACDEDAIVKMEAQFKDADLQIGRVCIGVYAMMIDLIGQIHDARKAQLKEDPDAKIGPVLMVAACEGAVCAMTQREEQWLELRSRSDLYTDTDVSPIIDIIRPLIDNAGQDVHVVFMSDEQGSPFVELMGQQMPNIRVSDVSVPNQLWNIVSDI